MDQVLLKFIDTLDDTFQRLLKTVTSSAGMARLTLSQLQYLDAVHELGEPTFTELADKLGVSKPSVTAGVNKLVEQGYAQRKPSHEDKRVVRVALTDKGYKLANAKARALKDYGDFIRQALTEEEAKQFEAIVTKLVRQFERP